MSGHAKTLKDRKSDAKVMPKPGSFGKTDVRYWSEKVFKRARSGQGADAHWTAQVQHLRRREQFPLGTANKAMAAAKARDIYLSLQARGWEETLATYKPKPEEPAPKNSTVGDLIREVSATTSFRSTTFSVYCAALRRIVSDIAGIEGAKSRFAPGGDGNRQWRASVDATPLSLLTPEAVQKWKLGYLKQRRASPEDEHRAVNTVNANVRNARALFSSKALQYASTRLDLPDPLPFSGVRMESRKSSTRYSSRIDARVLLMAAKAELMDVPANREQFKIFCLALLCGLRKREIDTLLWRSVDFDKQVIRIERTEYFQPKSEESVAEVDLAPELAGILKGFSGDASGEFVIESPNPPRYGNSRANYRAENDFKKLYAWLGKHGVSARKKLHELRKECGAVIANNVGIFAASRALRHADIRLTSQYYTDKKVRITTGLDSALSS